MSNILCHFEIPADDVDTLAEFYRGLFGWKIEPMGPPETAYWGITTAPEESHPVNGGMMKRQAPGQGIVDYILVDDVAASATMAESLGARVLMGRTEIPGIGWFAILSDPQGNTIGIFQPLAGCETSESKPN